MNATPLPRLAVTGRLPAQPGWWIQWADRDDWRPVSADFAARVLDGQLIDGERLVYVDDDSTPNTEAAA